MYVIVMRFSTNRAALPDHVDGHAAWMAKGFEDGVFVLSGALEPSAGGAIVAIGESEVDLRARIAQDPFTANNVVSTEVLNIRATRVDERLNLLSSAQP